jgi:hypothetical protein
MCASLALRAKNRVFRSILFCRFAAKKDFRYIPGCTGKQQPEGLRPARQPLAPRGLIFSLAC